MNNAIFIAFNDNHWKYARACINSLQKNYPDHPTLLIHYKGNDDTKKAILKEIPRSKVYINPVLPPDLIMPRFHKDVNSDLVYYKYLLWTEAYNEYDNIVHLDTDTIILKPFNTLFEKNTFFIIKNNISFKEVVILTHNKKKKDLLNIKEKLQYHDLHYPGHNDMVNAGIFMIPKSYRTREFYNSLIHITVDFGSYIEYADQSAISLWCMKHQIIPADDYAYNFQMPLYKKNFLPRYKNVGSYLSLKKNILNKISIIHFSGPIKPDSDRYIKWNLMGRYNKLFQDCYMQYAKELV